MKRNKKEQHLQMISNKIMINKVKNHKTMNEKIMMIREEFLFCLSVSLVENTQIFYLVT